MNIALMFSGGTIDSFRTQSGRDINPEFNVHNYQSIRRSFIAQFPHHSCDVVKPPFRIDSSQLTPNHFRDLVKTIDEFLFIHPHYDAIIVAFGTDTLSYIVPGVATALGTRVSKSKCVIFVTGMTAWDEQRDGYHNLVDAMHIAVSGKYRGVMTISAGFIYPPINLRKISHHAEDPFRKIELAQPFSLDKLSKVLNKFLGRGESIDHALTASQVVQFSPPIDIGNKYTGQVIRPVVAQLIVYPGLTAQFVEGLLDQDIEHVILWTYANGTAPVGEGIYSLAKAVRKLRQSGVAVYAISQQIGVIVPREYKICEQLIRAGCVYVTRFTGETLYSILLVLAAVETDPEKVRTLIVESEQEW